MPNQWPFCQMKKCSRSGDLIAPLVQSHIALDSGAEP